ncbi:hypothetical protein Hanom_Chr13g01206041 [Helianthus anomalus]
MNSEAHSCIVSLASLEIFALCGSICFMIRPTLAIGSSRSCWLAVSSSPVVNMLVESSIKFDAVKDVVT